MGGQWGRRRRREQPMEWPCGEIDRWGRAALLSLAAGAGGGGGSGAGSLGGSGRCPLTGRSPVAPEPASPVGLGSRRLPPPPGASHPPSGMWRLLCPEGTGPARPLAPVVASRPWVSPPPRPAPCSLSSGTCSRPGLAALFLAGVASPGGGSTRLGSEAAARSGGCRCHLVPEGTDTLPPRVRVRCSTAGCFSARDFPVSVQDSVL